VSFRSSVFIVVLAATALLVAACDSGDEDSAARGFDFYAEVRVEVEADDGSLSHVRPSTQASLFRWWYASQLPRWRWEIETRDSDIDDGTRVFVSDGISMWSYDDRSMTYQEAAAPQLPEGMAMSPSFSAPVGPANADDLDAFVELWSERGDSEVRLGGTDTVLGRSVQIVEIRPAWRSSSASATGSGQNVETSGGVIRAAVDTERMFVMRWEVDGEGGGQSFSAEVVALADEQAIEASVFEFVPPDGATKVEDAAGSCSSSSGTMGGSTVSFPPGFLEPDSIPDRFNSAGAGSKGGAGCAIDVAWAVHEDGAGGYLLIKQRARRALPESVVAWEPVALEDKRGYREPAGGVERLAWQQGDVAILLESDTLRLEELVQVANSFE